MDTFVTRWSREYRACTAVKTYTTSTDIPSTDPNVPKVTVNASRYIPNKTRIVVIAGVLNTYFTWSGFQWSEAGAVYKYYFQTTSGKPNCKLLILSDFRMEVGSYKSVRLTDKVFFLLSHPVVLPTRDGNVIRYFDFRFECFVRIRWVIRMPLVGNGIYGTGDKMSDTMNATKAITKAARASGRGRGVQTHNESNVCRSPTISEWKNGVIRLLIISCEHSKFKNLKNF
jgi:hypothetical protein